MKIYAYIDGRYEFEIDSNKLDIEIVCEKLAYKGKTFLGIRGSDEMLSISNAIENAIMEKYKLVNQKKIVMGENHPLDSVSINDYFSNNFPSIQRLELRADNDSWVDAAKNMFGKQYGYPLVWLNCNKHNHPDRILADSIKYYQWERCIFGSRINEIDKIGSLIKYFEERKQNSLNSLYTGGFDVILSSLKNSATGNILDTNDVGTNIDDEISNLLGYQKDKRFTFYNDGKNNRYTYITHSNNIDGSLTDMVERKLLDINLMISKDVSAEVEEGGFEIIDGQSLKKIDVLYPYELYKDDYAHVVMVAICFIQDNDKTFCNIVLHDALFSDKFYNEDKEVLRLAQKEVENFLDKSELRNIEVLTKINNFKYQLPLQTHCGRFVMTWMAAEVADVDIEKLCNYSEPFELIFGQKDKWDLNFPSEYARIIPEKKALSEFQEQLINFKDNYAKSDKNQWESIVDNLIGLIDNLKNAPNHSTSETYIHNLEKNISSLKNSQLKKIIYEGMLNLGYGTMQTFLQQAKKVDFQLTRIDEVREQYQRLDKEYAKYKEEQTECELLGGFECLPRITQVKTMQQQLTKEALQDITNKENDVIVSPEVKEKR